MALVGAQVLDVSTGTAPTFATPASTEQYEGGPTDTLVVKNASGSSINVTVSTPGNLGSGDAYPDKVYAVPATTGERWIPLISDFRDPSIGGQVNVTYSATTSVTRAVVRR